MKTQSPPAGAVRRLGAMTDRSLEWQSTFAHLLAQIPNDQRTHVVRGIQSGVIEGWEPTESQVALLVQLHTKQITRSQYRDAVALQAAVDDAAEAARPR